MFFIDAHLGSTFEDWYLKFFGNSSKVYFGFIYCQEASKWIPVLFFSFIGGLCLALMVLSNRRLFWALALGVTMSAFRLSFYKSTWNNYPGLAMVAFTDIWYFLYPVGACLGGIVGGKMKQLLTNASSRRREDRGFT